MNIEEDIKNLKTYIELVIKKNYCECNELNTICYGKYGNGSKNVAKSIENVLTAYEKEKETSHYIQSQLDIANAKLVEEKEKNKEYKNLLIDMVNQFAYEDNNFKTSGSSEQKIYTAGLSTLEDAFNLLDIDEGIKRENLWKLKEE